MRMVTGFRLAFLCLWLAACATRPPLTTGVYPAAWRDNARQLEAMPHWSLQGRIGLKLEEEGWHGSFHWQQAGDEFHIRITGPLGQGGVFLDGDAKRVVFRQGDIRREAADAETLLQEALGWHVPVRGMRTWVRGLPRNVAHAQAYFDDVGQLISLHEEGWILEYPRYTTQRGVTLPAKVKMENQSLQIRLVVDQWHWPEEEAGGNE